MNKILVSCIVVFFGLISCKDSYKGLDKVDIAKAYYRSLNASEGSERFNWFADSLTVKEGIYEVHYSWDEYQEFLKWDAVFEPSYEVLKIMEQDDVVKALVLKTDQRILFLNEKPMVTKQLMRFNGDKIISVETAYVKFDYKTWDINKNALLSWIAENHPELNGFINDQTEVGGQKYAKAIALYQSRK